jgi:ABC-type uncharacterized transport system ATPase subunit
MMTLSYMQYTKTEITIKHKIPWLNGQSYYVVVGMQKCTKMQIIWCWNFHLKHLSPLHKYPNCPLGHTLP